MKNLIYYPGFEIKELDWLKFALLYIDVLNPIIPESGDNHLSDLHLKLLGETDLIESHRPTNIEGSQASLDAIDEIEKVLKRPSSYAFVFEGDYVSSWKRPDNHDYTLFDDKYTDDWKSFCTGNDLGTLTDEGIMVHKDLAFIYMTLLAQIIADSRGISPITDYTSLDKFSIFTRQAGASDVERVDIAQAVIELELPANLSSIKLDDVIEIRNRTGFKERLGAFHEEFDKYFDKVESGKTPGKFVTSFDSIWKDFSDDILITGSGAISFGIGVWIALTSPQVSSANYLKEIAAGLSLSVGGLIRIKNTWNITKPRRYCRKYLTDLGRIKPVEML